MKNNYKILGVSETATDIEIKEAYRTLRTKYQEDRFLDGEAGNNAARKLTELDRAYEEIMTFRKEESSGDESSHFAEIDNAIKNGDLKKAQEILDGFNQRTAEWHYMQAVVFYQKGWANESKKQLEIALSMDQNNQKYKDTYDRLVNKINSSHAQAGAWDRSQTTGGTNGHQTYSSQSEPQMGGDGCLDYCCRLAICNICLNCFCNGCCH